MMRRARTYPNIRKITGFCLLLGVLLTGTSIAQSETPEHGPACAVDFDFEERDKLLQTDKPVEQWNTKWGPSAKTYPGLKIPKGIDDPIAFQRQRVVTIAKKYIGLPYKHKHIPAAGGLDCSNFTSWVYNYGFGIRFTSAVGSQAKKAGRRLDPDESFVPGDLLFQHKKDDTNSICHVVIYIGDGKLIDATKGKVDIRNYAYWYKHRLSHARRIIE